MELRGLCQLAPLATPTGAGGMLRLLGAVTTSSSSAASADEPSTPLGLSFRRIGDALPEFEEEWPPVPDPEASPFAVGRAMGAMGPMGPIGPTGRPIGPGSAAEDMRRGGWMVPAADPGAMTGEVMEAVSPPIFGGPIGAAGPSPRGNPVSNGGPEGNPRVMGEGPRAWGICGTNDPKGERPCAGGKVARGDIVGCCIGPAP